MQTGLKSEVLVETRVFDVPVTVLSTDGGHLENFNRGGRVRNIHRFGARVMFEPVSTHRVAGTYVMDCSEFELKTMAVRQAKA